MKQLLLILLLPVLLFAQDPPPEQPAGMFGAVEYTNGGDGVGVGKAAYFGFYYEFNSSARVAVAGSYGQADADAGGNISEYQAKSALIIDLYPINNRWTLFLMTEAGNTWQTYEGVNIIDGLMTSVGIGLRVGNQTNFFETANFWVRYIQVEDYEAVHVGIGISIPLLTNR